MEKQCLKSRKGRRRRKRSSKYQSPWPIQCGQQTDIVALRKWMKAVAGFKCHLVPAIFTGIGRGLMCKDRIQCEQSGDILVSLPHKLLITTKTVLESDIGSIVKSWEPKLTPQECLSVFLLWEENKKSNSLWRHYIQVLPASFTTLYYFSNTELSILPASVRHKAIAEYERIKTIYSGIVNFSELYWPNFKKILTFERFRWAWSVVNTRSVYYESEPCDSISDREPNHIALAPFLDLLNHSPTANIKAGYNSSTRCYEIVTYDNYKPYDQVFISYGCHSNCKLFMEYGFCVPNNPQDEFEISYDDLLQICKEFEVRDLNRKMAILRENKLLEFLSCSIEGVSWKLLTVLKTMAMSWDQLQIWNRIFVDEAVFDSTVPMATAIAKHLLQKYLKENTYEQANIRRHWKVLRNGQLGLPEDQIMDLVVELAGIKTEEGTDVIETPMPEPR